MFAAFRVKVISSPAVEVGAEAVFVSWMPGDPLRGAVTVADAVAFPPPAEAPVAVAAFVSFPLSMSAWVTV